MVKYQKTTLQTIQYPSVVPPPREGGVSQTPASPATKNITAAAERTIYKIIPSVMVGWTNLNFDTDFEGQGCLRFYPGTVEWD